jgi:hypothetical protein
MSMPHRRDDDMHAGTSANSNPGIASPNETRDTVAADVPDHLRPKLTVSQLAAEDLVTRTKLTPQDFSEEGKTLCITNIPPMSQDIALEQPSTHSAHGAKAVPLCMSILGHQGQQMSEQCTDSLLLERRNTRTWPNYPTVPRRGDVHVASPLPARF